MSASQMTLMPAHVPEVRPRSKAAEQPALFDLGELDRASRRPADEIANSPLEFQGRRASKDERAEKLPVILRRLLVLRGAKSLAKQLCRLLEEKTGRRYVERTVRGWFEGREPEGDAWEDLQLVFGRGLRAFVYYPESDEARTWWAEVWSDAQGVR